MSFRDTLFGRWFATFVMLALSLLFTGLGIYLFQGWPSFSSACFLVYFGLALVGVAMCTYRIWKPADTSDAVS